MNPHIHTYPTEPTDIAAMASWPATRHLFDPGHILALQAAQATGRPLLIRGEAGTGKSQLAHAAAAVTGRAFLPVVVGATTDASDLHWKFDAIARLADAHTAANHVVADAPQSDMSALHVKHYVQPGALWWALNWTSAAAQQRVCRHGAALTPSTPAGWTASKGVVLLIDEIDKAELDLPNGLLEVLANGAFDVPILGQTVQQDSACDKPLVIITTNDERELPHAFLRRCLVLTLQLPATDDALIAFLIERGELHYPQISRDTFGLVASMLVQDREAAREQRSYKPGLAEYLDLLRAVQELGADGLAKLETLKQFYFVKQPLPLDGGDD